jgi:hypothetical protein
LQRRHFLPLAALLIGAPLFGDVKDGRWSESNCEHDSRKCNGK